MIDDCVHFEDMMYMQIDIAADVVNDDYMAKHGFNDLNLAMADYFRKNGELIRRVSCMRCEEYLNCAIAQKDYPNNSLAKEQPKVVAYQTLTAKKGVVSDDKLHKTCD